MENRFVRVSVSQIYAHSFVEVGYLLVMLSIPFWLMVSIYPYSSWLCHWHYGNHKIPPGSANNLEGYGYNWLGTKPHSDSTKHEPCELFFYNSIP